MFDAAKQREKSKSGFGEFILLVDWQTKNKLRTKPEANASVWRDKYCLKMLWHQPDALKITGLA